MEEELMLPYYGPGYSGHSSIKTIMLSDGKQKHTMEGWVGYTNPNESIAKAKWTNLRLPKVTNEWKFEASDNSKKHGFTEWIVTEAGGKLQCDCGGFRWTRNCKHTKQVREKISA